MAHAEAATKFAYDVSLVMSRYLNACIQASASAGMQDAGAMKGCSFKFIIDEMERG